MFRKTKVFRDQKIKAFFMFRQTKLAGTKKGTFLCFAKPCFARQKTWFFMFQQTKFKIKKIFKVYLLTPINEKKFIYYILNIFLYIYYIL